MRRWAVLAILIGLKPTPVAVLRLHSLTPARDAARCIPASSINKSPQTATSAGFCINNLRHTLLQYSAIIWAKLVSISKVDDDIVVNGSVGRFSGLDIALQFLEV
jgi:hypothetical protein